MSTSNPPKSFDLKRCLSLLPAEPGVYIMKDRKGKIVYIGKSVNLRSRVRSYFSGGDKRRFVKHLPRILSDIEVIVTANGEDALELESSLIRRHRPRFNVVIKRAGVWLRLDKTVEWPRVELCYSPEQDEATYFGEYPSKRVAQGTMEFLERHFQLRTCDDLAMKHRTKPCFQHQIKRCLAP